MTMHRPDQPAPAVLGTPRPSITLSIPSYMRPRYGRQTIPNCAPPAPGRLLVRKDTRGLRWTRWVLLSSVPVKLPGCMGVYAEDGPWVGMYVYAFRTWGTAMQAAQQVLQGRGDGR